MAHILKADVIDFSAYMEETDTAHNVRSAASYADQVTEYFHGEELYRGCMLPWKKTHDKLGFLPGEVTLWGGMSGHGKSAILGQACTEFARTGKRIVIASMEMKPMITLARMCRQEYGRVPSVEEIRQFHTWSDKKLWLYDQQGAVKSERMLAVLRYSVEVLKADHFVIDSLMKCGMAEDDYTAQKHFVDQLCATAMDGNMHVHLVAHSRKSRDEFTPPGKMDVKGTGSITDQVSNVITVWRNKKKEADAANGIYAGSEPDCLLICDKQRNGEWEGKIGLFFNQDRMRFEENSGGAF